MSNYDQYREIRYNRTYRTLGKLTIWRVALGFTLIIYVLFLSGYVSQLFAQREKFVLAEAFMVSPAWMEKYKPEEKAFYEAGVLYEQGDYHAAITAMEQIEDFDPAETMVSVCHIRLAEQFITDGDYAAAYESVKSADIETISGQYLADYTDCLEQLSRHFAASPAEIPGVVQELKQLLTAAEAKNE